MRTLLVLALATVAAQAPAANAKTPCTRAAMKAAILASSLPKFYKDVTSGKYGTGPSAGGPYVQFCRDFTSDGRPDMVVPFASGGTAGDVAWFVFRGLPGGGWQLALKRLKLYAVGVRARGNDLIETEPVYRRTDPNCCPTGGFDHLQFHWTGSRFNIDRRWHDSQPRP